MTKKMMAVSDQQQQDEKSKYFRKVVGDITVNNQGQIKRILEVSFPSQTFEDEALYKDALASDPLSRIAYFNDVPAGAVLCKKESNNKVIIHIIKLVVLPAYRKLGLGNLLLSNVVEEAQKTNDVAEIVSAFDPSDVYGDAVKAMLLKIGFTQVQQDASTAVFKKDIINSK